MRGAAAFADKASAERSRLRYEGGLINYLEVAAAERNPRAVQRNQVPLHEDRVVTAVALIKAMGGG